MGGGAVSELVGRDVSELDSGAISELVGGARTELEGVVIIEQVFQRGQNRLGCL